MNKADEVFQQYMCLCRDEQVNLNIFSGTPEQTILSERMLFESARRDISILSRDLRRDVFAEPSLVRELAKALGNGCMVRVVTKNTVSSRESHPLFELREEFSRLLIITEEPGPNVAACRTNFTVVDGTAFRLSKEHHVFSDTMDLWAITNFHDPSRAARLIRVFEDAREGAPSVPQSETTYPEGAFVENN